MYCHTCGVRLAQALSYCNHCGANLSGLPVQDKTTTAAMAIDTLLWVIVGTTITFLGMALGALVLIKEGKIDERLGKTFVMLTFFALVVSEGVLVWRFLQLNRAAKGMSAVPQPGDAGREEPELKTVRALNEPLEPVASVTEQTTRYFEPISRQGERR